ncbi:uncharacterized protein BX663DRAFT_463314 [Cokeromyces recurvatus]|uniref:uncharacterized protein n=1 Tax=Cokeromyces recurvatus TaxID=90255 RepID=UPI00221EFE9E|nr:uncharacterized protein BX663DRAFT_463314 [Cokeromyces recurvatus]KAI7897639.1 hypothetical protein BX663DRAFT_463314 [Cokeromyces recurvatus]
MVYTSKLPVKDYPTNISVYDVLFKDNHNNVPEDKLIYVDIEDPSKSLTFEQVHTQILKTAASLKREFNLKKGDVVAICSPNQIEYPIIIHGAVCAGGVAAAIDQASSFDKIATDLNTIQAKIIIAHRETLDQVLAAARSCGLSESNILVFGGIPVGDVRAVNEIILGTDDELAEPYPYTPEEIMNDPAYLYFTSGTTGEKKAVMITQRNIISSMKFKSDWPFTNANVLAYTEFHHGSSLAVTMHFAIYFGVTNYVMSHFSMCRLCEVIERFKINITVTQPYVISALAKESMITNYDISSLKSVICCGAALDNSVTLHVKKRTGLLVINTYGMTEVLGAFDSTPALTEANSIGYLAPGITARIVDENGHDVPDGQMGELLIRGPTVTKGYYRNPEATAKNFDAEGYLHTGDLVKCDENELFYYIDRSKDLIKYHLHHIYPSDIENVLMTHPKVSDCAVIGIYYPEFATELPRAYVNLVNDERHTEGIVQELQTYADERLSDEKRLRGGVVIVDSFPRTASGKIQRRILKQKALHCVSA